MIESPQNISYNADAYLRLSKEDRDIGIRESNSIINQKELINEYIKKHPEIRIHKYRVDDGYTGVNFERPAFLSMMEDVKNGVVKCIIVKDLSRFGRDYIEVGRYLEKIFPYLGVRFIAINDQYDSAYADNQSNNIIIPFKNLINDAYSRDISAKVRSQFEVKRKHGEYIGAFAPYGYQKSKLNKNELIVDAYASDMVRDIFRYFIKGYSAGKIADRLNELGVLPPMDYKHEMGSRFYTGFKSVSRSEWNHVTVLRILQNEVYTGAVVQGKYRSPNHKIKKKSLQPSSLWVTVEDKHEAVITREEFELVQKLLGSDTKISPNNQSLYPFSGLLKCGDCKGNMVLHVVPSRGKKYRYYICGEHKYHKNCSSHSISADRLEACLTKMLNFYIDQSVHMEVLFQEISRNQDRNTIANRRQKMLRQKQNEIEKYNELRLSLYEDYQENLIDWEEYEELKDLYNIRIQRAKTEMERISAEKSPQNASEWSDVFKKYRWIDKISREVAVTFIDQVFIFDKNRIEIHFRFQNEYFNEGEHYQWPESVVK